MPLCLANYSDPILPCREVTLVLSNSTFSYSLSFFISKVCERVRTPCESFYTRYGFIWPDALKCEQYPSSEEECYLYGSKKE